ncbi:fibronectin type III domain-containing protein, partial [bacterium]|nr:fibronectin type III domain-containing protein [bacterium]
PLDLGSGAYPSAPRADTLPAGADSHNPLQPVRYFVTVPLADTEHAQRFRVIPYDDMTQGTGAESNIVSFYPDPLEDTTPPAWVDTVGVTRVLPGYEQLTVEFGEAVDDQSPPVSYRVYWAEGDPAQPDAPFDYATAESADTDASPYVITGLVNDQYYRVAVRALDSAAPANIEQNEVVLGHYAGPRDIYPPEWPAREGIADLFYGNGMAIVVWDQAVDSHTDEYGTWESGPVTYRVYYGPGKEPDWDNAEYTDFEDIGLDAYVAPIRELDTTFGCWFAVRVVDQAGIPNEDDNTEFIYSPGVEIIDIPVVTPPDDIPSDATVYRLHTALNYAGTVARYFVVWQTPDENNWLALYKRNGASLEYISSQYLGDSKISTIGSSVLDDSNDLHFLYTAGVGSSGVTINHLDLSVPQITSWDIESSDSYYPFGFDLSFNPWCIVCRLLQFHVPYSEIEQTFSYIPLNNEIQFFYSSIDEPDNDYSFSFPPALLNDGSLLFSETTYLPSRQLIFWNDSFSLVDSIPSDENGASYFRTYCQGSISQIDEYHLYEYNTNYFNLLHVYLYQGSDCISIKREYPIAQTEASISCIADLYHFAGSSYIQTKSWIVHPDMNYSFGMLLYNSIDIELSIPYGEVANNIYYSNLNLDPDGAFSCCDRNHNTSIWHYYFFNISE